jgi:hypothetical protein
VLDIYGASQIPLGLLRANRRIHKETINIPYSENIFAFSDLHRRWNDPHHWLEQIGQERRKVLGKVNFSAATSKLTSETFVAFV